MSSPLRQNRSGLMKLLGTVTDRDNITVERVDRLQCLSQQVQRMTSVISEACEALRNRSIQLAQEVASLRTDPPTFDECGILLASEPVKKVLCYETFTLCFRLINRKGEIVIPDTHDTFVLKAEVEATNLSPKKRRKREVKDALMGMTVANADQHGEVCFHGVAIVSRPRFGVRVRIILSVECVGKANIHPLVLDPILVLDPMKKRQPRASQTTLLPE